MTMTAKLTRARRLIKRRRKLDNAGQELILECLRDEVLKYVRQKDFRMSRGWGTPCCVAAHGYYAGILARWWTMDAADRPWLSSEEGVHIFSPYIPSDPGYVAMLITDLIEYRKTLKDDQ